MNLELNSSELSVHGKMYQPLATSRYFNLLSPIGELISSVWPKFWL